MLIFLKPLKRAPQIRPAREGASVKFSVSL